MTRSQMISAVCQATILSAASAIVFHHLMQNAWDDIQTSSVFQQFKLVMEQHDREQSMSTTTAPPPANEASTNSSTSLTHSDAAPQQISFYGKELPQQIFISVVLGPLEYMWQIFLERILPTRPRMRVQEQGSERSDFSINEHETREEKTAGTSIEQGKVRRSSVSWCNVSLKWVLDMTFGVFWVGYLNVILLHLSDGDPIEQTLTDKHWIALAMIITVFLSLRPLAKLIGFIVVPAHKRIVLAAGAELAWTTLVASLYGVFVPYLSRAEWVKILLANITDHLQHPELVQQTALPALDEL